MGAITYLQPRGSGVAILLEVRQRIAQGQEEKGFTSQPSHLFPVRFIVYSFHVEMVALMAYAMIVRDHQLLSQVCDALKFTVPAMMLGGSGRGVLEVLRKTRLGKRETGSK